MMQLKCGVRLPFWPIFSKRIFAFPAMPSCIIGVHQAGRRVIELLKPQPRTFHALRNLLTLSRLIVAAEGFQKRGREERRAVTSCIPPAARHV